MTVLQDRPVLKPTEKGSHEARPNAAAKAKAEAAKKPAAARKVAR